MIILHKYVINKGNNFYNIHGPVDVYTQISHLHKGMNCSSFDISIWIISVIVANFNNFQLILHFIFNLSVTRFGLVCGHTDISHPHKVWINSKVILVQYKCHYCNLFWLWKNVVVTGMLLHYKTNIFADKTVKVIIALIVV